MKLICLYLFTLVFVSSQHFVAKAEEDEIECTNGYLYISDLNSTKIYGYDLDGALAGLMVNQTINTNMVSQTLYDTSRGDVFASTFAGDLNVSYTNGKVTFVSSGSVKEDHGDHSVVLKNPAVEFKMDSFTCARPIHFAPHNNRVAIFCDGFYPTPFSLANQVNTTIWIVDESKFGSGAIVHKKTIDGSHHGVAMPVDGTHVIHSVALPARAAGNSSTSIPSGFIVSNFAGTIVHSLTDEASKATHCSGYHGSSGYNNTFAFACDAVHGGILVVDYKPASLTYASRALMYPQEYPNYRTGTLVDNEVSPVTVGNFALTGNTSHMLLFDAKTTTTLGKQNMLSLDFITGSQCSIQFEKHMNQNLFVWLPNGKLRTYNVSGVSWTLLNEVTVIPGMTVCTGTMLAAGYNMATIVQRGATSKIYVVETAKFTIRETVLPYMPFSAVISGVPDGLSCSSAIATKRPTSVPTKGPTKGPTKVPTKVPTNVPTNVPTFPPVAPTIPPVKKCKARMSSCNTKSDCCGSLSCRRSIMSSVKRCR